MKRQKKYWHKAEIEKDMAEAQTKHDELLAKAERLDAQATEFFKTGNDGLCEQARWNRAEAVKLREQANRIKTVRLKKLKQAHGALRTETLFGEPMPVVLQNL